MATQEPRRSPALWPAAVLVAAGGATYFNGLSAPFVFDDIEAIVENPHVRHLWPLTFALGAPAQSAVAGRPLVSLSLAANYAFGGLAPWGYHAFNLGVHVGAALLLYGIVRRTLCGTRPRGTDATSSLYPAFACALVWLVHPLQTEIVDYVTQRSEALMGACYFATLYTAIRAMSAGRGGRRWTIASIASCAVGMTAKESMVTAPVMVLLYDVVFQAGSFTHALRDRRRLHVGLFATWIILGALLIPGPRSASAGLSTAVSPWLYALNQAPMIARYLRLSVWPSPLVLDYGPATAVPLETVLPSMLVVFALLGLCVWAWRRAPRVGFLGAWFFVTLAPASSVVPIATEVGAERRMYLPLAALVVLAVVPAAQRLAPWLQRDGFERLARLAVAAAFLLVVSVTFAALAVRRNAEYHSPTGIWETVVARRPNGRARLALGVVLQREGRGREALAQLQQAVTDYPRAHYALGYQREADGDYDDAIRHYRAYISLGRRDADALHAYDRLGAVLIARDRPAEAVDAFRQALQLAPTDRDARGGLADALLKSNRFAEAAAEYRRYIEAVPGNAAAHNNLGLALARQNLDAEAVREFARAVELAPGDVGARQNLARALARSDRRTDNRGTGGVAGAPRLSR